MSNVSSRRAEKVAALLALASRIHFRLGPAFQRLFDKGVHSSGKRALMRNLVEHGPLTIPQMAAMRPVSRQFIRALVEEMRVEGLVQDRPNPKHKTAHLIALTAKGREQADADLALERRWIATLGDDLDPDELDGAAALLSTLLVRIDRT